MTSVSQQIPNFVYGISDQPDVLKRPGQVRDMINMYPDVTNALTKRPGAELVSTLGTDDTGTWFYIHKENPTVIRERYIGCIKKDGEVKVWSCDSGKEMDVTYETDGALLRYPTRADIKPTVGGSAPDYFRHSNNQQLKIFSVNDYTFVCNPLRKVSMSESWPAGRRDFESFVELKVIDYNRQYALNIFEPKSEDTQTTRTVTEVEIIEVDDFDENLGACPQVFTEVETFSKTFGTRTAENLRLRMTTTAQQFPDGDAYDCAYKHKVEVLFGGNNWRVGDRIDFDYEFPDSDVADIQYNMQVKDIRTNTVKANIALVRPTPTPATAERTITAEEILEDILSEINTESSGFFTEARIVGNGIYLRSSKPFTVDTPEETLFNIITNQDEERVVYNTPDGYTWKPYYIDSGTVVELGEDDEVANDGTDDWYLNAYPKPVARVNNIAQLPIECVNGFVVKVVNSENTKDDYYSEFKGNYDTDGKGIWEECAEPGGTHTFNPQSLPHQIVRLAETRRDADNDLIVTFAVSPVAWQSRQAGDDETVPRPSFAPEDDKPNSGKTITNIKLFRNRFVLLSDENVITSRAGDFFNLWGKSALQVTADDPVDITTSSNYAAYPTDCIVVNSGLVIFSPFNQFLLTTENDVFSPSTAKIKDVSSYDFNTNSTPFYLGTNVGFLATETSASKMYEMTNILRDGQPDVAENSKIVSRSLLPNLNRIAASKEMGLVLLSDTSDTIWGYKYFQNEGKRVQGAWFKWTMPMDVVDHYIMDDEYYAVLTKDGETYMSHINLGEFSKAVTYNDIDYSRYTYLDLHYKATANSGGVITLPHNLDVVVYQNEYPVTFTQSGNTVNVFSPGVYDVGVKYTGSLTLPTLYVSKTSGEVVKNETTGSLVIHRLRFNMGAHGAYTFDMKRVGRDNYSVLYESGMQDMYPADDLTVLADVERVIPVYTRNTDLGITVSSDFPDPFTLYNMNWEGDYNPRYYKLV